MSSLWTESAPAAPPRRRQESHRSAAPARPHPPADGRSRAKGDGEASPILGMLAERGFSPSQIAAAAKGARQQGVTVPDYLIGNGYVTAALPPHRPASRACHSLAAPFRYTNCRAACGSAAAGSRPQSDSCDRTAHGYCSCAVCIRQNALRYHLPSPLRSDSRML